MQNSTQRQEEEEEKSVSCGIIPTSLCACLESQKGGGAVGGGGVDRKAFEEIIAKRLSNFDENYKLIYKEAQQTLRA